MLDGNEGNPIEIRVEDAGARRTLFVSGDLCLPPAASLHRLVAESVAAGRETVVNLAGTTAVDLCGMQLLCSAHRTSRVTGAVLRIEASPACCRETAWAAGFQTRTTLCRGEERGGCLWKEE